MNRDSHKSTALDRKQPPKATSWLRLRLACAASLLPLALLLLLLLPATAQAQFTFTTNNGAITITGYTGSGGAVTIPDTINGLPVTSIGNSAFQYYNSLTNVVISGGVTNIGDRAFWGCTSLTHITLSEGVTDIELGAFFQCSSLIDIVIPNTVTKVGHAVLRDCIGLTSVTSQAASAISENMRSMAVRAWPASLFQAV